MEFTKTLLIITISILAKILNINFKIKCNFRNQVIQTSKVLMVK